MQPCVEYIVKEIKRFVDDKNIIKNIYPIQPYDFVLSGYFYIGFDFMLQVKSLIDYTNLFVPNDIRKNDEIILTFFNNLKLKWIGFM